MSNEEGRKEGSDEEMEKREKGKKLPYFKNKLLRFIDGFLINKCNY